MTTATRTARIAGLSYLGLAVSGMVGFLLIRQQLHVPDDAARTAANLIEHEGLARLGIAADLTVALTQAVAAVWFFRLFRSADPVAAGAVAAFGLANSVVVLVATMFSATALAEALREDASAARHVRVRDPEKVAYAMQTTLAVDEAEEIASVLRERFPAMSAPRRDDICYATTNRQRAVRAVADAADLVLVVGSANSSNSKRLVEVARRQGPPAHLVDDVSEVDLRWLAGARRVGITAGASAPPHLVEELTRCLAGLGRTTVRDSQVADEDVRFTLPREVG